MNRSFTKLFWLLFMSVIVVVFVSNTCAQSFSDQVKDNKADIEKLEQRLENLQDTKGYRVPSGTIVAFAGPVESIPNGWLLCDGDTVSREKYSRLFERIGESWGRGDGVNTFNLPDLQGLFLRGVTHNNSSDPNAAVRKPLKEGGNRGNQVGSYQSDGYFEHKHDSGTLDGKTTTPGQHRHTIIGKMMNSGSHPAYRSLDGNGQIDNEPTKDKDKLSNHDHDVEIDGGYTGDSGGDETRPKNAYVNWIIKI